MTTRIKDLLRPAVLLRLIADIVLIQCAVSLALLFRYTIVMAFQNADGSVNLREVADRYVDIYGHNALFLTMSCLLALGIAGVYTRGRFYLGRFKALVVAQAVSVAFLLYGALGYFAFDGTLIDDPETQRFPRAALIFAYLFTVAFLVSARVFIQIWQRYAAIDGDSRPRTRRVAKDNGVLVVGGAGYIGSALVPLLLDAGHRVRVLDLMLFGDEPLDAVKHHQKLEIIKGDFRHSGSLAAAMRDMDTVVHLAGIVGDPACNLDERLTIDVNLTSTHAIADMAKYLGVGRFIFASTCSVYGACNEMLDEKSEGRPVSLYGNTKLASEKVLRDLADNHFSPVILRFATIYGLSGRTRFDLVVNLLTAKAKVDGRITVFNGQQWRPFVHVVDAARAIQLAVQAPKELVHHEIFNVGSNDQNHTISAIGELIHEQVVGAALSVNDVPDDPRNYRVDFTKIRDVLDFRPRWTVEEGINQVLEAITSGSVDDYRDPKFSNYEFLNMQGTTELARDHWAVELIRDLESV